MRLAKSASGRSSSSRAPTGEKFTCTPSIGPCDPTRAAVSYKPATKLPNAVVREGWAGSMASTGESKRKISGTSLDGGSMRHRGVAVCSRQPQ